MGLSNLNVCVPVIQIGEQREEDDGGKLPYRKVFDGSISNEANHINSTPFCLSDRGVCQAKGLEASDQKFYN